MSDDAIEPGSGAAGPRQLSRPQRRVLGVLIEKAFTTPDQYPLTLKSATAGCNQKSNREPVTAYSEDQVARFLDELRKLGLVAVVHTESGRTERFRHYARKAYPFTEPQLAIMTELWLRGRQQPGELRGRAGRMVPIDSLEILRAELAGLIEQGYVQTNGPLDRRGVEVDHNLYQPDEGNKLEPGRFGETDVAPIDSGVHSPAFLADTGALAALEERIAAIESSLSELQDGFDSLRRQLGVST
jgi:uncharacterized protein